jgi:hypothetical protein
MGSNLKTIKDDGSIDLSGAGTTPLVIPKDVAAVLASPTTTTTSTSSTGMAYPGMPDMYQTTSDTATNSMPTRASSLSTSGGYVDSVSRALILGLVAFIISLVMV